MSPQSACRNLLSRPAARSAFVLALLAGSALAGQEAPGVVFAPEVDAKLDGIKAARKAAPEPSRTRMWVDFSTVKAPRSMDEFHTLWHQPPVCQGLSGMCWCFSTTSLLESEAYRKAGLKARFSSLHSVYWEYVEKARGFVDSRGASTFGQGSQDEAALRAWERHGVVPADQYTGLPAAGKDYDHDPLFKELHAYLEGVKAAGAWNGDLVAATVRAILDHHLGAPPAQVTVGAKVMSPADYRRDVVKVDPADYVGVVSFLGKPYWKRTEYAVPDNWWHGAGYLNVPLDAFMAGLKGALRQGYTVGIAVDMSEPGYSIGAPGIAVVPEWDIPGDRIDARARQFRFENGSTTDDHGMHVVGWLERDGKDWYLVKDSWSSAWNNDHPGYYFIHEDYLKLKCLAFTVHKDAVATLFQRAK
jgi:bleomycin hydrolase